MRWTHTSHRTHSTESMKLGHLPWRAHRTASFTACACCHWRACSACAGAVVHVCVRVCTRVCARAGVLTTRSGATGGVADVGGPVTQALAFAALPSRDKFKQLDHKSNVSATTAFPVLHAIVRCTNNYTRACHKAFAPIAFPPT